MLLLGFKDDVLLGKKNRGLGEIAEPCLVLNQLLVSLCSLGRLHCLEQLLMGIPPDFRDTVVGAGSSATLPSNLVQRRLEKVALDISPGTQRLCKASY